MKTIWKFCLDLIEIQEIEIPKDAEILAVQTQNDQPCLWCLVKSDAKMVKKIIRTFGTGHEIDEDFNGTYLGTYQLDEGNYVYHVFEV